MRKIFLSPILFCWLHVYSQNCTVSPETLKGTYEGDCKNDKANGTGTAKGQDTYTGEFKNGYPEGKGKYFWKNGDWFDGQWKKGQREGQGTMHYAGKESNDSTQAGSWKKDKYIGPYIIYDKTSNITGFDISKENDQDKEIIFTIKSASGGALGIHGQAAKPVITNIQVLGGRYLNRLNDNAMPRVSKTILQGVEFPIRLKVTLELEIIELEILEAGKYSLDIRINI